jgi:hypothetical protein
VDTFKQQMQIMKKASWDRSVKKIALDGKRAIVIVGGTFNGVFSDGRKDHTLKLVATAKDTWVKTPKGYKLQKTIVQQNTVTIDGKQTTGPKG